MAGDDNAARPAAPSLPAGAGPVVLPPGARPLITVSGTCSGVGKTTLVELLIRRLRPIAALKVTVVDSGVHGCPIDRACGVCSALTAPFRVLTERPPRARGAARKDTQRYAAAGAAPVIWVQTRGSELDRALAAGLAAADNPGGVVLEGNTPVRRLAPDLALLVDRPARREIKPSAHALAAMKGPIDAIVLNCPRGTGAAAMAAARQDLGRLWPGVEIVELDLGAPGPDGDRWLERVAHRCSRAR
jgi:hypothetical protein